jgi:hypothetical protein
MRIEHIHRRLEIWAMWKVSGGSIGGSSSLAMWEEDRVDTSLNYHAALLGTINEDECAQTDAAILKLPEPHGITVAMYYLHDSGRTQRKLGISRSVLSQRLGEADKLLDELLRKPASPEACKVPEWRVPDAGSFPP